MIQATYRKAQKTISKNITDDKLWANERSDECVSGTKWL